MSLSTNTRRLIEYLRLMRIHKPIPMLLMWLPIVIIIFSEYYILKIPNFPLFKLISVSFFGAIITRSLGCIINDYLDQDFDKKTQRTKDRPLALEDLEIKPTKTGITILISLLTMIALLLANSLGSLPLLLAIISGSMVVIYPLTKRFFILPQLFLGVVYNMGLIIIPSALPHGLNLKVALFFIINILWTLCYDTVYAAQDIEDDKKNNLHSSVKTFGKNWPIVVDKIYNIVFALLIVFGMICKFTLPFYIFTIIGFLIMKYQFKGMRILQKYQNFFEYNVIIFIIILCGVISEILFRDFF